MTDRRYRRSPFCILLWEDRSLCVLNCNSFRMFRGAHRYFGILHELGTWTTAAELAERSHATDQGMLERVLQRLVGMDLVVPDSPKSDELFESAQRWDLIELAMQRQSAWGGFDATKPRSGPPPPAFKPPANSLVIALAEHGIDGTWTLRDALEKRRTIRKYSGADLDLDQLARFLYSTARVMDTSEDPMLGQFSLRPYPSGGARHPLEIYLVCNAVTGLEPGAYHYHAQHHALYRLETTEAGRAVLNQEVRVAAADAADRDPPVVLLITAVFERTMWKYERIGLSNILKDLGCLYQTMYLVAAALGLAPCAIGGGRESDNARWLGLDPLVESQVGCFLLGRPLIGP